MKVTSKRASGVSKSTTRIVAKPKANKIAAKTSSRPAKPLSSLFTPSKTTKKPRLVKFKRELAAPAVTRVTAKTKTRSVKELHIPVIASRASKFKIKVSTHPLDQYLSPFQLDLSKVRHIERVASANTLKQNKGINHEILPAGKFLKKIGFLTLIDFDRSPIISQAKKLTSWLPVSFAGSRFENKLAKLELPRPHESWLQRLSFTQPFFSLYRRLETIVARSLWQYQQYQRDRATADDELVFQTQLAALTSEASLMPRRSKPVIAASEAIFITPEYQIETVVRTPALAVRRTHSAFTIWQWQPHAALRPLVAFATIALIIALPFKTFTYWQEVQAARGAVLGEAESALTNLETAQHELKAFDFAAAQQYFAAASTDFIEAQQELTSVNSAVTTLADLVPTSNSYRSGKHLLSLGRNLSEAGGLLLGGVTVVTDASSTVPLTTKIKLLDEEVSKALPLLEAANKDMKQIDPEHIPESGQDRYRELQLLLPKLTEGIKQFSDFSALAQEFLGDQSLRRYLVVFQNDNELRASGGFMGSFALIDISSGKIRNIQTPAGGTYDVRAGLLTRYAAPKPLQIINPQWEFQDANWSPNWPTSAQTIESFFTKSGGPSIDGVIAINSDFLPALLEITGPIDLPEFGKSLTADNVEMELQNTVEFEADKKAPKKIIGALMPELMTRLQAVPPEQLISILATVERGLREKDIQLYFKNDALNQLATKYHWNGELADTDGDYLSVVAANIGGGKTDNVVRQSIDHQVTIDGNGGLIDRVVIRRHHFGPIDTRFTNVPNRSYVRVYVPQGSILINAAGFSSSTAPLATSTGPLVASPEVSAENTAVIDLRSGTAVYDEHQKTVFANWMITKPGETTEAVLVYRLPFKISRERPVPKTLWQQLLSTNVTVSFGSYSLIVQKQAGSNDDVLTSTIHYPSVLHVGMQYPRYTSTTEGITTQSQLVTDQLFFTSFNY